jgi:hypothetical protein
LKELIYKMGIAAGLDIGIDEFDTIAFNGFIQNLKEQMEIVQSRLGSGNNIKTMSIADAIAQYDDVPMSVAVNRYKELAGIKIEEEGTELTISDSGGESEVTGEIAFTPGISNDGENIKENVNEAFVTGPNNINGGA